ncbi:Transporter OS=Streptomyces tendae OX=1932 GN=F3L20_29585 PE=4 SV=1 [Streptomyces tendae]
MGVLAVPLALLVCVALARAVAAANVRLLTSRKGRDLAVLSGLVVAIGAQVVNFGAQRLGSGAWTSSTRSRTCCGRMPGASATADVQRPGG